MNDKVTVKWPDTLQEEDGEVLQREEDQILFKSDWDGSINWVPLNYLMLG